MGIPNVQVAPPPPYSQYKPTPAKTQGVVTDACTRKPMKSLINIFAPKPNSVEKNHCLAFESPFSQYLEVPTEITP